MKKKLKNMLYNFIKIDGITALLSLVVIIIVSKLQQGVNVFDWSVCFSIVAVLFLHEISNLIKKPLMRNLEDSTKLTCDYESLCSKYNNINYITGHNNLDKLSPDTLKKIRKTSKEFVPLPVVCDYKLQHQKIEIKDSKEVEYHLPESIQAHFDELLMAHSASQVFNQLTIRVNRWYSEDGTFVIETTRTTYFNSLVTNRAMDFRWTNGTTVRELFEYGPHLHSLEESRLSNHIGFNGFVESSDGNIVFVKRANNLSIGKGTYGNSISASLKTRYALDTSGCFSEHGLLNGILCEIHDELKISENYIVDFTSRNLIAAYRDIVEGGKPQLLFYAHTSLTKAEIEGNFYSERGNKKHKQQSLLEDGDKLLWIPRSDFGSIYFSTDRIIYQGKSYHMVPSAIASTVMLVQYLKEEGLIS